MKVSVSITTYNQEKFISQAIESALMQNTNFDFEIIIGEDDSTDNTREIVKTFREKYPEKIRLFLNDRKNVIYIDGKPTGRWNFVNNLKKATGQYVALLEGDDYWTSPYKLQKQVDYLDNHPKTAICFHNVNVVYEDCEKQSHPFLNEMNFPLNKTLFTVEDLLRGNFIQTCSAMFRAGLFNEIPEWFYRVPMGDWPLHILNALHGNIGYINDILGAYRVSNAGIWSSDSRVSIVKRTINAADIIRCHLDRRYEKNINKSISRWHYEIVKILFKENDLRGALHHVQQYLSIAPFDVEISKEMNDLLIKMIPEFMHSEEDKALVETALDQIKEFNTLIVKNMENRISSMENTVSWRVMTPLRKLGRLLLRIGILKKKL